MKHFGLIRRYRLLKAKYYFRTKAIKKKENPQNQPQEPVYKRGTKKIAKQNSQNQVQSTDKINGDTDNNTAIQNSNTAQVKKIFLTLEGAKAKKEKLEAEVTQLDTSQKNKRKRIFQELAHLKKALENPELYLVDPVQHREKQQKDKQRRIQKKLEKSELRRKEVKKENRHKKRCLRCNSKDHIISECPEVQTGFCYKCGANDHSHKECTKDTYDYASCFVCGQNGHIAKECPKNEKGLYKNGGSCFGCGSVRHTLKECPERHKTKFNNKETF